MTIGKHLPFQFLDMIKQQTKLGLLHGNVNVIKILGVIKSVPLSDARVIWNDCMCSLGSR